MIFRKERRNATVTKKKVEVERKEGIKRKKERKKEKKRKKVKLRSSFLKMVLHSTGSILS